MRELKSINPAWHDRSLNYSYRKQSLNKIYASKFKPNYV